MSDLCARHDDALVMALELRGLLRPTLIADADRTPLIEARAAIGTHASNFAGKAAVMMLATQVCPLCFVNAQNRAGVNVDGWVEDAAEEALERDCARADGSEQKE